MAESRFRTRTWVFVMYPESMPDNWKDILEELCVPCFVSPLHSEDKEEDGTLKKAHYHVMLMYSGMQTQKTVKEVADKLNAALPQGVKDPRSMARYLCHMDQPSKHQYNAEDVLQLNGADYFTLIMSSADKYQAVREMIQFCKEQKIYCYADLLEYSAGCNDGWFRCLCDNGTIVMKEYLKSLSWKMSI